ncbi:MAG: NUDIX domain-containing protein [Bacteroidales bacterium]|nr:NUDIX domain-containing protein [Bacteroidales bacterium]
MYKVFFNDRKVILTDDFINNFKVRYGLFYKFRDVEDLKEIIDFFGMLKKVDTLFLFHHDVEELRNLFRSCFTNIHAGGGLVRNRSNEYLLIFRRGVWDLPKGKLGEDEDFQTAALREVEEECGLQQLEIVRPLLSTYHTYPLKNKLALKKTTWFEMLYKGDEIPVPQTEEDITEVRWMNIDEIPFIVDNCYKAVLDVFIYAGLL